MSAASASASLGAKVAVVVPGLVEEGSSGVVLFRETFGSMKICRTGRDAVIVRVSRVKVHRCCSYSIFLCFTRVYLVLRRALASVYHRKCEMHSPAAGASVVTVCPMCSNSFPADKIEAHAAGCAGAPGMVMGGMR